MEKIRNDRSLYTDVVLFFFSKTSASASSSSPTPLCWGSINPPAVLFFCHVRSTDFEEKIEGLWTGYNDLHQSP